MDIVQENKRNRNRKVVLILDGKNFAWRAVTGLNELLLSNEGKEITGGFNAIRMINRLITEFEPDAIVTVWDVSRPTNKKRLLPEYKQNRTVVGTVDPFQLEIHHRVELGIPQVRDVLSEYGSIHIDIPDSEADDVIGAMIYDKSYFRDYQKILVTTDKDYVHFAFDSDIYLVRKVPIFISVETFPLTFCRLTSLDSKYKFSLFGFHLFHALSGDAIDNIPGIPGLGKVRCAEITQAVEIYFKDAPEKLLDFKEVSMALEDLYGALSVIPKSKSRKLTTNSPRVSKIAGTLKKLFLYWNIFEFNWSFVDPKFWVENGVADLLLNFKPEEPKQITYNSFHKLASNFKISSTVPYYKLAEKQNKKGRDTFSDFKR